MNINKTNPMGLWLIEKRFKSLTGIPNEIKKCKALVNDKNCDLLVEENKNNLAIRMNVFNFNKKSKVLRITKKIMENCKLINIDSIKENININAFNFTSLTILLDNDKSGLIKVERLGSDFDFLYLKNLDNLENVYFNTYSFLTKEFNMHDSCSSSVFVVKLLAYLYYGDITTKSIKSKGKIKLNSFSKFINNSKYNITFVDSLWRQRINVDGFAVRGHFRMQPFGKLRSKNKLIWIEEFSKTGYNRNATIEKQKK